MDNSGGDQDRIEELQRLIREEESNIVRQYRALCDDVDTVFLRIIAQNRAAYEAVIEQMTFKQKENLAKLMDNNAEISGLWDNLQTGIRYMDGVAASNELGV